MAEFNFRVEWIPGLTMIADCFSRLVLTPCEKEAISLPEIVFGVNMGLRIHSSKRQGAVTTPLLLYVPESHLVVEVPLVVDVEDEEEGWRPIEIIGRAEHQQKVTFAFTRIICILIQIIRKMHEIQTEGL